MFMAVSCASVPAAAQPDPHDADDGPAVPAPPRKLRIALLGDSHVEALGPLLTQIVRKRGSELNYEAHRGSFTRDWAENAKWGDWLNEFRPDRVVIVLGTNDALAPNPDAHRPHFGAFIERVRKQTRAIIVWIEPPRLPRLERKDKLRLVRENIRSLRNVIVVDGSSLVFDIGRDQLHPTSVGYRKWADEIATHF